MSRMLCKCGATMGTSISPSPFNIYIYYESEIGSAIAENSKILLSGFLTDWDEINEVQKEYTKRLEEVEYWYCPECKRVYETQIQIGGHWLRVYRRTENPSPSFSHEGWVRIYIFKETETDAVLEESPQMLLSDYLKIHEDVQYLLSPDEKTVVAVSLGNQKVQFTYILEEMTAV